VRSRARRIASLRTKLLAIVFVGALLPLTTLGLWLVRNTQRSAEASLRGRLDSTLVRASNQLGVSWIAHRSALFDLAEDSVLRSVTSGGSRFAPPVRLKVKASGFASLRSATHLIVISDASHAPRWVVGADENGAPVLFPAADSLKVGSGAAADGFATSVVVRRGIGRDTLGVMNARFRIASLIPGWTGGIAGASAVITVVDRATSTIIAPLPFDASLLRGDRFRWGGDEWLTESRAMDDPNLEIIAAAPLTSFMQPFDLAARNGAIALAAVFFAAFALVILLTRRVTHSLVALADAADAVAAGDLERRVDARGEDEVGRLAAAFNLMVESLRKTLAQLSQRQAVAAVGEFASALAHEIRNPLSALRLNLQHVEERLENQPKLQEPVRHALRDIARLESTVAGALRLARTGTMSMESFVLGSALEAATRVLRPEAVRRNVCLEGPAFQPVMVRGNAAALEQLFLNLLLNAVEATPAGGSVGVTVTLVDGEVCVDVWDTGSGFAPEANARAFEPFFTTKAEGTGLGLSVAKRIATAHGGRIAIESRAGRTDVTVRLPVVHPRNAVIKPAASETATLGV
jgi:signal transduction histidine kinase